MQAVKSSNIKAIGYEPETQRLHVQFGSGKTYAYDGVKAEEHEALINAASVGSHFHHAIRGKYNGVEVR
jgi:hypothetical protein